MFKISNSFPFLHSNPYSRPFLQSLFSSFSQNLFSSFLQSLFTSFSQIPIHVLCSNPFFRPSLKYLSCLFPILFSPFFSSVPISVFFFSLFYFPLISNPYSVLLFNLFSLSYLIFLFPSFLWIPIYNYSYRKFIYVSILKPRR